MVAHGPQVREKALFIWSLPRPAQSQSTHDTTSRTRSLIQLLRDIHTQCTSLTQQSRGPYARTKKNPFQAILYLTLVVFNKGPFQQHFIFEHVITETFEIKIEPVTCSARCVRSRRTLLPKVFQQPCNFLTSKPLPDLLRSLLPYSSFFWTVNNPAAP